MRPQSIQLLTICYPVFMLILIPVLLFQGCTAPENEPQKVPPSAPESVSSSACINVDGTVPGNPMSGSNVSLYEVSSRNFSVIMPEIRSKSPAKRAVLNETRGFNFNCLSLGNYAFVIPISSYDGVVGFPLPYEFDCENISLDIAFQGGDYQYSVGAFSIIPTSPNTSRCDNGSGSCPRRGRLYHGCPLDLG